jgi:DNA-binding SARP family transcriptional activator/WD40 repeat protein
MTLAVVAIAVLGPLEVDGDASALGPRDRVVLAVLALRPGEVVGPDGLADALWGEEVPASWSKVVQGCVMRVRKVLGPRAIETLPHGYRLTLPTDAVDAHRFERLLVRGRELMTLGEPERASYVIGESLALWHGRALVDLEDWEPGRVEAARLEELRLEAEEAGVDASLRAGRHREVLGEAQALVAASPLREDRWALLSLAQYRSGRQGDALRTLHRARTVLAAELGVDPGPDLVALEQAILRQDPSLAPATEPAEPSTTCPYLGLVPYDVGDADTFFGRDDDITACLDRLAATNVVVVVGPSGSGKSSLVRAGIAAALRRDGRSAAVVTPGVHPMDALTALGESEPPPVLVVDQCEEAVTICDDPAEQAGFFDALAAYPERAPLVVALRADRMTDVSRHPAFARLVERGLHLLTAMAGPELRAAIEGPADQAGMLLEPGLVDLLVRDVEGEPGALPLLSHALRKTWETREGRTLTVAAYRQAGGIRGAVSRSAEAVYEQASPTQRPILLDLMLRLVTTDPEGALVRVRMPRRVVASDPEQEQLIERLVGARLLTSDDGVVELAHEAVARAWPRLQAWLDDDVEGQRMLRHLTLAADTWDAMGKPESELYRGVRLTTVLDWRDRARPRLSVSEQAFLDASRSLAETEQHTAEDQARYQLRVNHRLRFLVGGVALMLVVALIAAAVAIEQRGDARDQARVADAARLIEQSRGLPEEAVSTALLLALESRRLDPADATDAAVEAVLTHVPAGVERIVEAPGVRTGVTSASPDGSLLAVPEGDGDVRLIELASGRGIRTLTGSSHGALNVTEFSPDGRWVMGGSGDGIVRIWEVRTGKLRSELRTGDGTALGTFDPTEATRVFTVSDDQVVRWDISAPERPVRAGPTLTLPDAPGGIPVLSISTDGRRLAAGDFGGARTSIWDTDSGALIAEHSGRPGPFTPDGSALALVHPDRVEFVDVETGAVQGPAVGGFTSANPAVVVSPDGHRVAIADLVDASVRVFDRRSGEQLGSPLTYFAGGSWPVRFLDRERLLVKGTDEAVVWRYADADGPLTTLLDGGHRGLTFAQFTPNGGEVLTAGARDGQVLRWRARDGRPLGALDVPYEPPGARLALSGDGRAFALSRADGTVELWDRTTGRLLTSFATGQGGGAVHVEWSPAGPVLATAASVDLSVVLWDVSDLRHPTVRARLHAGRVRAPR